MADGSRRVWNRVVAPDPDRRVQGWRFVDSNTAGDWDWVKTHWGSKVTWLTRQEGERSHIRHILFRGFCWENHRLKSALKRGGGICDCSLEGILTTAYLDNTVCLLHKHVTYQESAQFTPIFTVYKSPTRWKKTAQDHLTCLSEVGAPTETCRENGRTTRWNSTLQGLGRWEGFMATPPAEAAVHLWKCPMVGRWISYWIFFLVCFTGHVSCMASLSHPPRCYN